MTINKNELELIRIRVPVTTSKTPKFINEIEDLRNSWKDHKNIAKISFLSKRKNNYIIPRIRDLIVIDIVEELISGKNIIKISSIFGINRNIIAKWIKDYNLTEYQINGFKKSIATPKEFVYGYINMRSQQDLAKEFKAGISRVRYTLVNEGVIVDKNIIMPSKVKDHILKGGYSYTFSQSTMDLIIGCILGDGNLSCNGLFGKEKVADLPFVIHFTSTEYKIAIKKLKSLQALNFSEFVKTYSENISEFNTYSKIISSCPTGHFNYRVHKKEKKWVNFLAERFSPPIGINQFLAKRKPVTIHGYAFKPEDTWNLSTHSSVEFAEMYYEWYAGEDHKKIVPNSFTHISPDCLLAWYVGDGSCDVYSIEIYSCNFTKYENEYLRTLFEKIDIPVKVRKKLHKGKDYYSLRIPKSGMDKFFNYLSKADPEALQVAMQTVPWKFDPNLTYKEWKTKQSG